MLRRIFTAARSASQGSPVPRRRARAPWGVTLLALGGLAAAPAAAQEGPCGPLPIPHPGCRIGGCVDGQWEEVCPELPDFTSPCGPKPLPAVGCRIDACVGRRWQQICGDVRSEIEPAPVPCGIKPVPPAGCRIGECVDGQWQMTCR